MCFLLFTKKKEKKKEKRRQDAMRGAAPTGSIVMLAWVPCLGIGLCLSFIQTRDLSYLDMFFGRTSTFLRSVTYNHNILF